MRAVLSPIPAPPGPGRTRLRLATLAAGLLLALTPAAVRAQGADSSAIQVRVATVQGVPLEGALVTLTGTPIGGRTDRRGRLRLSPLPGGVHFVEVRLLGYRTERFRVDLSPGWVDRWDVRLQPQPIPLAEVRVTADPAEPRQMDFMRGFWERRDRAVGEFLTREEILRHGSRDLSNILHTMSGLRTTSARMGRSELRTRGQNSLTAPCRVRVYVDGIIYRVADDLPGISPLDIEGIEVYRGRSEIPAEFADPDADCGVVVIWTRRSLEPPP